MCQSARVIEMNTARPERLKCLSRKKKTVYIACVTKMSWQLVSTILGEKRRDRGNEVVSLLEVTQE